MPHGIARGNHTSRWTVAGAGAARPLFRDRSVPHLALRGCRGVVAPQSGRPGADGQPFAAPETIDETIDESEDIVDIDLKKHGKLAALGARGVAVGCVALFAFMVWVVSPSPTGGIDGVQATIAYLGMGIPLAAIIAVHLVFARQLANYARSE